MGEGPPRDRVLRHEETCAIRGALDDPSVLTCASNARRNSQRVYVSRSVGIAIKLLLLTLLRSERNIAGATRISV
jgi:hypothetical protein